MRNLPARGGRRQPARVCPAHLEDSGALQSSEAWERLVRINPGTCLVHLSFAGNDREYVTPFSRPAAHPLRRRHVNRALGILLGRCCCQRVAAETNYAWQVNPDCCLPALSFTLFP